MNDEIFEAQATLHNEEAKQSEKQPDKSQLDVMSHRFAPPAKPDDVVKAVTTLINDGANIPEPARPMVDPRSKSVAKVTKTFE